MPTSKSKIKTTNKYLLLDIYPFNIFYMTLQSINILLTFQATSGCNFQFDSIHAERLFLFCRYSTGIGCIAKIPPKVHQPQPKHEVNGLMCPSFLYKSETASLRSLTSPLRLSTVQGRPRECSLQKNVTDVPFPSVLPFWEVSIFIAPALSGQVQEKRHSESEIPQGRP